MVFCSCFGGGPSTRESKDAKSHDLKPVAMRAVGGDGALPRYSQEELRRATGDWRTKLGEGGFGAVYKGMLLLPRGGDGEAHGEGEGDGEDGEDEEEVEEGFEETLEGLEVVEVDGKRFVPVAVKMCHIEEEENSGGREQLMTEIMVMTALRHPNVLRLLGMAVQGQTISMVSEFVPGGDVSQRLEKARSGEKPFPWKDRLRVAEGSLEGLAAIHEAGFIHRDFKSANVLLTKSLVPKVADFGLAKTCQDKTHVTTRVAGSMGYMDPSYFERGYLSAHCDTFAFGIFLLELMTGYPALDEGFQEPREKLTDPDFADYSEVVDKSLEGQWTEEQARFLVGVVRGAILTEWEDRLTLEQILDAWKTHLVLEG
ncbi:unnamed protein product [Closterium sp. NIES-64]|nr:unnamed protein product [Closterium sp. NIES-65]CAI5980792.1 unnamed protein product [Closterium sp. NIES-64]